MSYIKNLFPALAAVFFLAGCGGGGGGSSAPTYTGVTTPAAITSTNAEDLGTSSGEATGSAVAQDAANDANPYAIRISYQSTIGGNNLISNIATALYNNLKDTPNLPTGVVVSYTEFGDPYLCGGSVSVPSNFGNNGTLNGTINISNLCYDDPYDGLDAVVINGSITFTHTATQLTMSSNITVTVGTESESVNMTISCQLDSYGYATSCSISSDFVGSDDLVYRVSDFSIIESSAGTYYFDSTFYHPEHGYVTVNADAITFGCADGRPDGGTITFTGAGGSSGDITFRSDCTGYDGSWNDGVTSGTFSGNWL